MLKWFTALPAKTWMCLDITRQALKTYNPMFKTSRRLHKLALHLVGVLNKSTRRDLPTQSLFTSVGYIIGFYYSQVGLHDAIQKMSMVGHGLNSMILLRSQLDCLMLLLYCVEPGKNLEEVEKRVQEYLNWIVIRMHENAERSDKFSLVHKFVGEERWQDYKQHTDENFEALRKGFAGEESSFKRLKSMKSFPDKKKALADRYDIGELYEHLFAETSASVHLADLSDRMFDAVTEDLVGFGYKILTEDAGWQTFLSNILLLETTEQFAVFFGLEKELKALKKKYRLDSP